MAEETEQEEQKEEGQGLKHEMAGMGEAIAPNAQRWVQAEKQTEEKFEEDISGTGIDADSLTFGGTQGFGTTYKTTRRKKGSASDLATEEVVNELDIIDSRIIETNKILENSIGPVLNLIREGNLETNKILTQLLGLGGTGGSVSAASGGGGSGEGGGGLGNILKGALEGGLMGRMLGLGGKTGAVLGGIEGAGGLEAVMGALGLGSLLTAAGPAALLAGGALATGAIDAKVYQNVKKMNDDQESSGSFVGGLLGTDGKSTEQVTKSLDDLSSKIAQLKQVDQDPSTSPDKKKQVDQQIIDLQAQEEQLQKQKDVLAATDNGGIASKNITAALGAGLSPVQGGPFGLDTHPLKADEVMRRSTQGYGPEHGHPPFGGQAPQHIGGGQGGSLPSNIGLGHIGGKSSIAQTAAEAEGMKFFTSHGYTSEQAAAIMGNLQQESTFNPNSYNPNDPGGSLGIGQWNRGRRDNMVKFVSDMYKKPYDQLSDHEKYEGQLGFVDHELHSKDYAGAMQSLQSRQYGKFTHQYEGYGDNSEGTRLANASRIYRNQNAGMYDHLTTSQQGQEISGNIQVDRPQVERGAITFEGDKDQIYHYGSGSPTDSNHPSVPIGSQPIGAMGRFNVPGGVGYPMGAYTTGFNDPKVPGRTRDGMVIHMGRTNDVDKLASWGCVAIPPNEIEGFKKEMDDFRAKNNGHAFINVFPDGHISISAQPQITGKAPITPDQAVSNQAAAGVTPHLSGPVGASGSDRNMETLPAPQVEINRMLRGGNPNVGPFGMSRDTGVYTTSYSSDRMDDETHNNRGDEGIISHARNMKGSHISIDPSIDLSDHGITAHANDMRLRGQFAGDKIGPGGVIISGDLQDRENDLKAREGDRQDAIKHQNFKQAQRLAQTQYDKINRLKKENPNYDESVRDMGIQAHFNDITSRKPDFLQNNRYKNLFSNLTKTSNEHTVHMGKTSTHNQHIINHHMDQSNKEKIEDKKVIGATKPPSQYLSELFAPTVSKIQMA